MLPKGSLGDPLDAAWTALGSLRDSVGRSGGSWDALWSTSGALWELWGVILELLGTIWEAFWDDVRDHFLSLLRVLWKPASVLFWSFLGRSGLHRSRSLQNGRGRSRLVDTNEIVTCSLARELANISGAKPKQCWDELRIHMKFLTKTGKIDS